MDADLAKALASGYEEDVLVNQRGLIDKVLARYSGQSATCVQSSTNTKSIPMPFQASLRSFESSYRTPMMRSPQVSRSTSAQEFRASRSRTSGHSPSRQSSSRMTVSSFETRTGGA